MKKTFFLCVCSMLFFLLGSLKLEGSILSNVNNSSALNLKPIKFLFRDRSTGDTLQGVLLSYGMNVIQCDVHGQIILSDCTSLIDNSPITISKAGYQSMSIKLVQTCLFESVTIYLTSTSISQPNTTNSLTLGVTYKRHNNNFNISVQNPVSNAMRFVYRRYIADAFRFDIPNNEQTSNIYFNIREYDLPMIYLNGIQDDTKIDVVLDDGTIGNNDSFPIKKCNWICRLFGCCK